MDAAVRFDQRFEEIEMTGPRPQKESHIGWVRI